MRWRINPIHIVSCSKAFFHTLQTRASMAVSFIPKKAATILMVFCDWACSKREELNEEVAEEEEEEEEDDSDKPVLVAGVIERTGDGEYPGKGCEESDVEGVERLKGVTEVAEVTEV